ncbi:MAG: molybdopterin biosynthesis protein, partial [Chloroflexi bacterium]|nr:molybdopterin biosynthesis protein [Chloroflexota bacterium]
EGIDAGSPAEVELLRPIEEIETTIVAIGSHDLSLDLLSSLLRKAHPGRRLSSAHVGSLGGLVALKRVEAHLAGSHLLDEETGDYNVSYIKKTLGGQPIVLMNLVYRDQGLMVAKGNPKHIVGLKDLVRKDATFINRQRGSGTRVLLDYELKRAGLDASKINGYEREEFTHTSVAAMIASGAVDVGLGVLAAARALGIDFVPLMKERYDLVIPQPYYESALLEPLLAIIRGKEFQETVFGLGGYDISETGKVLAIIS